MWNKKRGIGSIVLLCIAVMIHIFSSNKLRVETGYSTDFYKYISTFLRNLYGTFPFSVGDLFYGLLAVWLLYRLVKLARILNREKIFIDKSLIIKFIYNIFLFWISFYILFNILWGINYNRAGIASQLDLKMEEYNRSDLLEINALLLDKVNYSRQEFATNGNIYPERKDLFAKVAESYKKAALIYPFLEYHPASIKVSMWGWLGNYTGFTGYYNPLTAEAQLNTTVPQFLHPFITCHEVAHQLGYAGEMEANFVGYLAAVRSEEPLFQYSAYLELFLYANRTLFILDSVAAIPYRLGLNVLVKADLKILKDFNDRHRSYAEPVVDWVYDKFLRGNGQTMGVMSYDEVTAFIVAFHKKFGSI